MCDIAPLQMKCKYDKYPGLFCCQIHHLCQAFNNLYQSIPIIRVFISEYHCPDFDPLKAGEQNG